MDKITKMDAVMLLGILAVTLSIVMLMFVAPQLAYAICEVLGITERPAIQPYYPLIST